MKTAINTLLNDANQTNTAQNSKGMHEMNTNLNPAMRMVARLVLFVICFVWYGPHAYATVERIKQEPAKNLIQNHYKLGAELESLRKELKAHLRALSSYEKQLKKGAKELSKAPVLAVENLDEIRGLDEDQRDTLQANIRHLKAKQLAGDAIAKQTQVANDYEQHMEKLYQALEDLESSEPVVGSLASAETIKGQKSQVLATLKLLDHPFSRPHESFSNDLDFIQGPPRDIYTSLSQVTALLGTDGGNYTQTDSATAATQAITDQVTALGTDPLDLYNWVHDNVRWVPSYGVMQGADYTLQTLQGNAFDTSSLLISLLRAAGHEARYRYGVINVPVDQMRNWVGNVRNADAVTNLMSQGGIPVERISYGGAIEEIRFEHVWVEVEQGPDWISLDPSFKQYTYSEGMDLQSAVNFDAAGLLDQLQNTSTSNEAEGWVQGLDASLIEAELSDYQTQLESYITTNMPDATLGDVLGLQIINSSTALALSEAAPSYDIQLSAVVDQLPDDLFYHFRYQVGSTFSTGLGTSFSWNSEIFTMDLPTTELVGRDIAMSFRPATAADEAVIESYLPETINTPEDLPSSLPAGSINMVGELTIDGTVVHSTPSVTLGEALKTRLGFVNPMSGYSFTENNLIAGQYRAIAIDMQGVSPQQLQDLQTELENTQTQLQADNTASLTKHDVVGNIMQAGIQGYMAMTYASDRIAAQAAGVAFHRQPSYGTFGTHMEVSYLITGTPNEVHFTGVVMDVDRLAVNVEEKENCYEGWVAFNRASGMRNSAYEHSIPEQLFSTETEQAEGVSTAKALAIAMANGQRIYTLTGENAAQLNNITIDDGARAEIQQALVQGFEVTVHESPISVNGWTGSGYTIIDSDYGVGAYKISGGSNGNNTNGEAIDGLHILTIIEDSIIDDILLFLVGLFDNVVSVASYLLSSYFVLDDCIELGTIMAAFAAIGLLLIGLTMILGFIYVLTMITALSRFLTSLFFASIVAIELAVLGGICRGEPE